MFLRLPLKKRVLVPKNNARNQMPSKKILLLSDWHYRLSAEERRQIEARILEADIVILLGDIDTPDAKAIRESTPRNIPILYVLGNHNEWKDYLQIPGVINLDGRVITVEHIRIGGLSGSNRYKNNPDIAMRTEKEAADVLSQMSGCDILCSHTCSYSFITNDTLSDVHHGYRCLDAYIGENHPVYHLFGHLHQSHKTTIESTDCICTFRASMLDTATGKWEPFLADLDE